jgi:hypothetical protein
VLHSTSKSAELEEIPMDESFLPPSLLSLSKLARSSPSSNSLRTIGSELDAAFKAIEQLRAVEPESPVLKTLQALRALQPSPRSATRSPVTAPSPTVCPCCGRPF